MLNLNSIILFSESSEELVKFYKNVFEKEPEWSEGGYTGFQVGVSHFIIGPHSEVHGKNTHPQRLLLNFEANDVEGEFSRIKKLGATVIAKPYHPGEAKDMLLATFADPDGNYFQLASPMK
ncbi:MAG TPA: VOC family protein [Patescibacteria group bacterium]|nr:VOC family protein [Patescibacteria group bacterium]